MNVVTMPPYYGDSVRFEAYQWADLSHALNIRYAVDGSLPTASQCADPR